MNEVRQQPLLAFGVAMLGVGCLSAMDAAMKALGLGIGVFESLVWRTLAAAVVLGVFYFPLRTSWPSRKAMKLHLVRGTIMLPMSMLFFWGLARVPIAQAIALAFVAPLIALGLAALILKEQVGRNMLAGSLAAFAGVIVIFTGQAQAELGPEATYGAIAILCSAVLYAFNIIVMRPQAQVAKPLEIAFFQFAISSSLFWLVAFVVGIPDWPAGHLVELGSATVFAVAGMLLLAFAYARAGAAYLSVTEYTGFLWAMLFGWLFFAEIPSLFTIAGAALIVAGCILAARTRRVEHIAMEAGA